MSLIRGPLFSNSLFVTELVILCFCVLFGSCLVATTTTVDCRERLVPKICHVNYYHGVFADRKHCMFLIRKNFPVVHDLYFKVTYPLRGLVFINFTL